MSMDAASVEQVKIGGNLMEMSLAHKFEGFYLQSEPLKIYEDAFLAKCKKGMDKGRYAQQELEEIRGSYASLGIHVDQVTHRLTIEKFFTKVSGEELAKRGEERGARSEEQAASSEQRAASSTGGELHAARGKSTHG